MSVPGLLPAGGSVGDAARGASCSTTAASPAPRSPPRRSPRTRSSIGAKRSETGHPLFVAGPQVGYFFPEFFAEMELSGAGFAVRGAVFPGVPFVLIGRGPDFAWSATSSQADNLDLFVETLCDDDTHYLYRGQCEPMRRFFAGTLKAQGQADQEISYYETTHGPVVGLRHGRREARRDLGAALDAWSRAALDARVLRPQHGSRRLGEGLPLDDERRRVQLQLVLRRRPRHRALLERAAPDARSRDRSGAPDGRDRGLRLARLRPVRRARTGDQPAVGSDRELEQQARGERRRRRLELRVRVGASQSIC